MGAGGPAELREVACNHQKIIIIIIIIIYIYIYLFIFIIYYLFIIFSCLGLSPADVRGVKPWEPPHLLPPDSYLLPPTSTTI
jgi:hypothetical protein